MYVLESVAPSFCYIGNSSDTKPLRSIQFGARLLEQDTGKMYRWIGDETLGVAANWVEVYDAISLGTRVAGERQTDAGAGEDCLATSGEFAIKAMAYNGAPADRTVYDAPCVVAGIEVTTAMSAHASGFESDGAEVYPVPASRAVGIYRFPEPVIFPVDCVWDPGSLTAGALLVWWRPLDPRVTWVV